MGRLHPYHLKEGYTKSKVLNVRCWAWQAPPTFIKAPDWSELRKNIMETIEDDQDDVKKCSRSRMFSLTNRTTDL